MALSTVSMHLVLLLLSSVAHAQLKTTKDKEDAAAALEVRMKNPAGQLLRRQRAAVPLYVFGDSYADTGNHDPASADVSINKPWRYPYGSSWPGQPAGRYSDGHVLTDVYALQMHLPQPVPFRKLNIGSSAWHDDDAMASTHLQSFRSRGINFAFGGSGVFTTLNPLVYNVSVQIENLQATIKSGIVNVDDLASSMVLFVIIGNDYLAYLQQYPDFTGIESFISKVVEQMAIDIQALSEIGFTKFVITSLPPIGCIPRFTYINNYSACLSPINDLSAYHNSLLESQISNLIKKIPNTSFAIIDLFSAFTTTIEGATMTLRPCCEGSCGEVDEDGTTLYTVCLDPTKTLFWDEIHPTNFGWKTIVDTIFSHSLETHQFPIM